MGLMERNAITNLEFLFPLKSHGKLVAILATGKKQSKNQYSQEDLMLVMAAVNQAGVVLENALLYHDIIQRFKESQTGNEKTDSGCQQEN
jgi:GAF domain-containing protein